MYFSNLLGSKGNDLFNTHGLMSLKAETNATVEQKNVVFKDGVLCLDTNEREDVFLKNLFIKEDNEPFHSAYKRAETTYGQVKETEENPLVVVLAKGVKFYEGVPTYIRYINIDKDAVLVCLVYGACQFVYEDNGVETTIDMQRCMNKDFANKMTETYNGKKLQELCKNTDKQSGYDVTADSVNAVVVSFRTNPITKVSSSSYKSVKEEFYVIDNSRLEKAREKAEAREKAKEQAEIEKLAARKEAEMKAREKAEAEMKEDISAITKGTKATGKDIELKEDKSTGVNKGAAMFMDALRTARGQ